MGFVVDYDAWKENRPNFESNRMTYIEEALKCIQGRGIYADLIEKIYEMGIQDQGNYFPEKAKVRRAFERYEDPNTKRVNEDYIRRHEWDIRSFREVGDKDLFEGLGPIEDYPFCNDAVNIITRWVLQNNIQYFSEQYRTKTNLKDKCRDWWVNNGGLGDDTSKKDNSYNLNLESINEAWDLDFDFEDDRKIGFRLTDSSRQSYEENVLQTPDEPVSDEPLECLYIRLSGEDEDLKNRVGMIKFGKYSKGLEARFESCLKNHFKLKICKIYTFTDLKSDLLDELTSEHERKKSKRTLPGKSPIVMIENIILYDLNESGIFPCGSTKEYFDLDKFNEIMGIVNPILHKYELVEVPIDNTHKLKDGLLQCFFPD